MADWKTDLRYLDGCRANTITVDQKKHILIGMMPDNIADQLTIGFKKEDTYEEMEQNMIDLVDRMMQREKKNLRKNLGALEREQQEGSYNFEDDHVWDHSANCGHGGYIFSAVKRQRTDDGNPEEASKKKGPVDGCFVCGGDHYANECPQQPEGANLQKAKGKGKGGKGKGKSKGKSQPYIPYSQWDHIRPSQWPSPGPTPT